MPTNKKTKTKKQLKITCNRWISFQFTSNANHKRNFFFLFSINQCCLCVLRWGLCLYIDRYITWYGYFSLRLNAELNKRNLNWIERKFSVCTSLLWLCWITIDRPKKKNITLLVYIALLSLFASLSHSLSRAWWQCVCVRLILVWQQQQYMERETFCLSRASGIGSVRMYLMWLSWDANRRMLTAASGGQLGQRFEWRLRLHGRLNQAKVDAFTMILEVEMQSAAIFGRPVTVILSDSTIVQ